MDAPTAIAEDEEPEGVTLELACTTCGLIVRWRIGDPFPDDCPRCDD